MNYSLPQKLRGLVLLAASSFLIVSEVRAQASASALSGGRQTTAVRTENSHPAAKDLWSKGGRFEGFRPEQEVVEKRTRSAKHFKNADGSFTVQTGGVYHYKDKTGKWKDIDLTLTASNAKAGYAFANETNEIKTYLPSAPGSNSVQMELNDHAHFNFWNSPAISYTLNGSLLKSYNAQASHGVISEHTITYPSVFNGMSEEFEILQNGIENNRIIHTLPQEISSLPAGSLVEFKQVIPLVAGYTVDVNGVRKSTDFTTDQFHINIPGSDNGIFFSPTIVFDNTISKDEMALLVATPAEKLTVEQQSKLGHIYRSSYKLHFTSAGIEVTTVLAADWLKDATRSFPVTVDPTVTITPPSSGGDFYGPMTHWYGYQRHADLYLASEIGTLSNVNITAIEYNRTNTTGTNASKPTKIFMKTITANQLSGNDAWNSTTYTGGLTALFDAPIDLHGTTTGWKMITLTTPFTYLADNLLVMAYDAYGGGGSAKYLNQSTTSVTARQAYKRQDNTDPGDGSSTDVENRLTEIRLTYVPNTQCAGTPSAGTIAGPTAICPSTNFVVSTTGSTIGAGITYQWESSPAGIGSWLPINGATNTSYTVTGGITTATDYHLLINCAFGGGSDVTATLSVNVNPFYNCYCTPASNCTNEGIENVTFSTINNSSTFCTNTSGYTDFSAVAPPTVVQGQAVPISVTAHINSNPASAGVWIDFNHNGTFDASEYTSLGSSSGISPLPSTYIYTGTVVIAQAAQTGITRMRVRQANQGGITAASACTNSGVYGEYEDYLINIDPAPTCSSAPSAGTVNAPASVCANNSFTINASGYTSGLIGISYEWQVYNTTTSTWDPASGTNNNPTYVLSSGIPAATDFRFAVTCATGGTVYSAPVTVALSAAAGCYCTPSGSSSTYGVNNFSTTGGYTNISNLNSGASANGYGNYTSQSVTASPSGVINFSTSYLGTGTYGFAIFVDYNQNGSFADAGETVFNTTAYGTSESGSFTIPAGAPLGSTRIRIVANYNNSTPTGQYCATGINGEFEDYTLNVTAAAPSCLPPTGVNITAVTAAGATINWTASTSSPSSGYDYYYSSSNTAPTAATLPSGSVGVAATSVNIGLLNANTTYYVWVRANCGGSNTSFWASAPAFTTLCTSAPLTFIEGFNTSGQNVNPACWFQQNVSGSLGIKFVTTYAGTNPTPSVPYEGTRMVFYNSYSNSTVTRLVSAPITTTGVASADVNFQWYFSNNGGAGSYLTEGVTVQWSTNGTTWNDFPNNFIRRYGATTGWAPVTLTLPAGAGNQPLLYVGLKLEGNGGYDIYLDSLSVAPTPSCAPPASITATATTTTATISWLASASTPSGGYDYYVSSTNVAPTASTTLTGSVGAGVTSAPVSNLTAGTLYYVWVRSNCGGGIFSTWATGTFYSAPANDNWVNATVLTHGTTCTNTSGTTVGATQSVAATPCNGNPDDDVWYSFVASATDVKVELSGVTQVVGSSNDMYFQVLSGNWGSLTSLLCRDPNTGVVSGLTVGQTYYIRVYTYGTGNGNTFSICLTSLSPAPGCPTLSSPANNASVSGALPTLSWSSATNASSYDIYLDGNTTPTTLVGTANNAATSYTLTTPLAAGNYYWYVVAKNSAGVATGCASNTWKFTIAATPANDECANATVLTQGTTCVNASGTTVGATNSMAAAPCNGNPDDDVWYSFVATSTDVNIALSGITGTSSDMYFQLLSGACGSLTSLYCSDPETGSYAGLTIGQTYYIRVYTYWTGDASSFSICVTIPAAPTSCPTLSAPAANATVGGGTPVLSWNSVTGASSYDIYLDGNATPTTLLANTTGTSFVVTPALAAGDYYWYVVAKNATGSSTGCATNTRKFTVSAPPPVNDNCINAVSLTQTATCTNTSGTTVGATQSMAATPCNGTPDDDVWYSFVATATDAKVALSNITSVVGTSTDMYFQVLSGTCGSMTSLLCSDPESALVGGLTVGQTYYIRVYTYGTNRANTFDICVTTAPTLPGSCATLNSPANNATVGSQPTLTWSSVTDATAYDVYLDGSTVPTTIVATVTGTSYTVLSPLAPGIYYWYVVPKNSAGAVTGCGTNALKFTVAAPPVNDPCANAINISNQVNTPGTTLAATQSMPSGSCAASTLVANDVWYYFTTTSAGNVTVTATNTSGDVVLEVLSGTCGSLTQLDCQDGPATGTEVATLTNLAAGTYYVRVYGFLSSETSFTVQVTGAPLKIKLTEIAATNAGARNRINWNTASEMRGDYFELERSSDGNHFMKIASINAKGEASSYTYWDEYPVSGTNYYRLKLMSATGEIGYSKVVTANVLDRNGFNVEVYPNPVTDKMTVKLTGTPGDHGTISITDVSGKVVRAVSAATSLLNIDLRGLASGIYILNYSDSKHQQTIKLSKD